MSAQPFERLTDRQVQPAPLIMEAAMPSDSPVELDDDALLSGWIAALDRLEEDLEATAQLLAEPGAEPLAPWTPPALGPMPIELLGRATALNRRQQKLTAQLAAAMQANTRQQSYAAKVSDATSRPTRPTYFDGSL